MNPEVLSEGLLLPETFMQTRFFIILATLVAFNTVIYGMLSVIHVIPKLFKAKWLRGNKTRSMTRSIYPDGPK